LVVFRRGKTASPATGKQLQLDEEAIGIAVSWRSPRPATSS
jgi:hypothetical protein